MSPNPSEPAMDLARQIRAELSEPSPAGFQFVEQVIRQDGGLDRRIPTRQRLKSRSATPCAPNEAVGCCSS